MYIKTLAARLPKSIWLLCAPIIFLLTWTATAQSDDDISPLFAGDDLLNVRIIAPLTSIMFERDDVNYVPATFQYLDTAGQSIDLDIGLRTRGNFRRQKENCEFAPLRINFKESQVRETLFAHQDKLKLVTHCQDARAYQGNLLREYLAYRVFNNLTDASFRVRLLRITYVDTDSKVRETVKYGFLIEHKDRLAQRIHETLVELERVFVPDLQPAYTNLTSLFHYFLGDTDFSQIAADPDDYCCHNHVLFSSEDGSYFSIPYDFDMSGFVDATYSDPREQFDLRNPKPRWYRGWCTNNGQIPASVNVFDENREEIYALINDLELLSKYQRSSLTRFVDTYYASVETTKKIERNLVKDCKESDERRL